MTPVENDPRTLQQHISRTYVGVRIGVAVIGAALPLLLWIGGAVREGLSLKSSMSSYYYTGMRDVLVGALVCVGVFLYLYKGFSRRENWALNIAGLMAVVVAFVPTRELNEAMSARTVAHNVAAVTLFLCIAYVSIFRAVDTLSLVTDTTRAKRLRTLYRSLGTAMVASPLTAVVLSFVFSSKDPRRSIIFFVEAAGVWAFSAYWFAKSREIAETDAEVMALQGRLQASSSAAPASAAPGRMVRVG